MHVSKFQLGILNGCCITKAYVKHVLVARKHAFTESVGGNPARAKFAAENKHQWSGFIGSVIGLSPVQCQVITWTVADKLSIAPLGTNTTEIYNHFHSLKKHIW